MADSAIPLGDDPMREQPARMAAESEVQQVLRDIAVEKLRAAEEAREAGQLAQCRTALQVTSLSYMFH